MGHQMNIFVEGLQNLEMVSEFLPCIFKQKNKYKVSDCCFKDAYKFQRLFRKLHQIFLPAFGTIFRITGGFRNNFWSWLSESRNKLCEEGY